MKELTYHGFLGVVQKNKYLSDDCQAILLGGNRQLPINDMLSVNEFVKFLAYGNEEYFIVKKSGLTYVFVLLEDIISNSVVIKDYYLTTIIPDDFPLINFIENKFYDDYKNYLIELLMETIDNTSLSYIMNTGKLRENLQRAPQMVGKTLKQIAKENDIRYNSLWALVKQKNVPLEEAIERLKRVKERRNV